MKLSLSSKFALAASACFAPFAIGATCFSVAPHAVDGPQLLPPCPLLSLTGIPCPFCGATRAVIFASHGSSQFLNYNFFWTFALLIAGILFLGMSFSTMRGNQLPSKAKTFVSAPLFTYMMLAAGWLVALANHSSIA